MSRPVTRRLALCLATALSALASAGAARSAPAAAAVPGDFVRTLFSAVHGVVALGLQQKVAAVSPDELRAELRELVAVLARGLAAVRHGR